jgi:Ca2+-transporting ATPase
MVENLLGLTTEEANKRFLQNGANELPEEKINPIWLIFLQQFMNPLTYILFASALISIFVGEYVDAYFIFVVVLFNAIIGAMQEFSANKSAQSLKKMVEVKTFCFRDGIEIEIPARELVVGDLVSLKDGSKIPADITLIYCKNLKVDESMLTGESLPIDKDFNNGSDNLNKVFAGTIVIKGQGQGIVNAIALNTEIGKIAEKITQKSGAKTPLVERMENFTKKLTIAMAIIISLICFVSLANGIDWRETLMLASSLGVAAIPEGLPIAITICLAIGMNRMAKKNVIVKNLMAVEALGSCTVIASDKTGTLTINEMSIVEITTPNNTIFSLDAVEDTTENTKSSTFEEFSYLPIEEKIIISFVLPNEATQKDGDFFGDPVDIAFLRVVIKKGYILDKIRKQYKQIELLPYSSEAKYSASINEVDGKKYAFVKGAPETIMEMSNLNNSLSINIQKQFDELSKKGLRVLAVACGEIKENKIEHLQFLALVSMIDPLRPEAKQAVKKCQDAGIKVAMITGDNPKTAFAISSELGFVESQNEVVSGEDIAKAKDSGVLDTITKNAKVYARIAPIQKLDIVQSIQRNGNFVAVTGDGVNDAPALKNANVGIAMGDKGTDIARESASIILADDNFASIVYGVTEGRLTYSNIRKIVFFLMSTAFAEIGVFFLSIIYGIKDVPFTPIQLLWINLITETVQGISLAMEKSDGTEMKQPPKNPGESIFDKTMIKRIILSSSVMIFGCFYTFRYFYNNTQDIILSRSVLLFLMILFQNIQVFNARSEVKSVFSNNFFTNPFLLISIFFVTTLHIVASYLPFFDSFLKIDPLTKSELIIVIPVSLLIIFFMEIEKFIRRKMVFKNK